MATHEAPGIVLGSDKQAAFVAPGGGVNTRLGLHVTSDELAIWQSRATSGPYKTTGDAGFSYTPGDWDRIVTNKNSFESGYSAGNNASDLLAGYTGAGCVPAGFTEPNSFGFKTRDAAFYSLVAADATVRAHVLSHLQAQIAQAGVDFGNSAKWCTTTGRLGDGSPSFPYAEWVTRILFAYDYIRIGGATDANIEFWLFDAGNYFRLNSDVDIVNNHYNSSESNFFAGTLNASGTTNANTWWNGSTVTYDGGSHVNQLGLWFNNRRAQMMGTYGQIGVLLGDTQMINWAKAWVREFLKYYIYPDTSPLEMYRSYTDGAGPDQGWQYSHAAVGRCVDVADALARTGDYDLYNFSTNAGGLAAGPPSKTLKTAYDFFISTSEGTFVIYVGTPHDNAHLVDGVWTGTGIYAYEIAICKPNLYWQDAGYKTAYMNPGAANKLGETTFLNAPNRVWGGSGSCHPGMLFMFGQLEGVVDPYP